MTANSTNKLNCPSILQLGEMTFSMLKHTLFDATGKQIHLRPQSQNVLRILAENSGSTVSKDFLIETVWPNVIVSDDSLTQCVADIRRALADKKRTILRTVPKSGYVLHPSPLEMRSDTVSFDFNDMEQSIETFRAKLLIAPVPGKLELLRTNQFLDQIGQIIQQRGALTTRTKDSVIASCASVDEALSLALHTLTMKEDLSSLQTWIKIGICLERETNGSVEDKLKDIAFFPLDGMSNSIILSLAASEHTKRDVHYDLEDLGTTVGAILGARIRAFRITDRRRLAPSKAILDENVLATIAILPLFPRSSSAREGMFGELIADDLVSVLSQSSDLQVVARLSTTNLRVKEADIASIANYLNTNFVVSGSYTISGSKLKLYVELSDVTSQIILWSDRPLIEIEEITQGVSVIEEMAARIRQAISVHETRRALRFPLNSLQNYTLLISAINLMHRLSENDFQKARDILQELLTRCPGHPEPLAWIGRWHVLRTQQGWTKDMKKEADLALSYTKRALEIDPNNALSLSSEGAVLVNLSHDLDEAEHYYSSALKYNPSDSYCRLLRGTLFAFQGRGEAARRDCELGLRLAPLDPHRFLHLGLAAGANIAAGDYDRALELANASYRLNRCHASTLRIRAVAQQKTGFNAKAEKTVKELMRLQPNLRVQDWLDTSPSGRYAIGHEFAEALRDVGVPK